MFRNYLKSAFRNITRNKFYTFLNILGLTVGLVAFIFLFLFIKDELSFDKYHGNASRIHRLESDFTIAGKNERFAIVPIPMAHALKLEYPEVENFVRLFNPGNTLFRYNDLEYYEDDIYFADSTIFQVFTHRMIDGDPDRCLVEPKSMVLTESMARKYFDDDDPIGKMLESGEGRSYVITGIVEDVPKNSHLRFDALCSVTTFVEQAGEEAFNSVEPGRFWNIGVFSYIMLNENASMDSIHAKFPQFYDKYMRPIGDAINASFDLMSTPMSEVHFSEFLSSDLPKGSMSYVYIFSAVAVFILLIAAINYMNMATARSARRSREVGIRKVAGAFKGQLIRQFLSESLLLSIIALILSVFVVYLLMPDFNNLADKEITFDFFTDPVLLIVVVLAALIIGIISGSYPSFYLSSFQPVTVIKGTMGQAPGRGSLLRKILVTFQFLIAISMIIATIVVTDQLSFLRNKDLGFEKENMMILELQDTAFRRKADVFKEELMQNPNITGVTNSIGVPGQNTWIQVVRVETDTAMIEESILITACDFDYAKTYGLEFVEGRDFDESMGTDDEEAIIVNETAVKVYGWGDNPLGKKVQRGFNLEGDEGRMLKVIGVIKDYHFKSLHNAVQPQMLLPVDFPKYHLSVKTTGENIGETIGFIEDKWNEFGAKRTFDYRFLEETWDEMYDAEKKLGIIFRIATLLTIFIALLGLLGLSSFVAEQKTKEIGIRKVVGASVANILGVLSREFFILIAIAFVISLPVAWWQLAEWLDRSFIYHIEIDWIFIVTMSLLAGFIALAVGLLTMSYFTIKAATNNPVNAITYE